MGTQTTQSKKSKKVYCFKNQYDAPTKGKQMLQCDNNMLNFHVIFNILSVFLIEHIHGKMVTLLSHISLCNMSLHAITQLIKESRTSAT